MPVSFYLFLYITTETISADHEYHKGGPFEDKMLVYDAIKFIWFLPFIEKTIKARMLFEETEKDEIYDHLGIVKLIFEVIVFV